MYAHNYRNILIHLAVVCKFHVCAALCPNNVVQNAANMQNLQISDLGNSTIVVFRPLIDYAEVIIYVLRRR